DGVQLIVDLLDDVLLVGLKLLLSASRLFLCLLILGLERLGSRLKRRIGRLSIERVDSGLDRLPFRLKRGGQRLFATILGGGLALESRNRRLAGVAGGPHPVDVDNGNDGRRQSLRLGGGGNDRRDGERSGNEQFFHQNWVP